MFAAAVAAGLVAFGDGIESANTVGYQTFTCQPNTWYLLGAQFESTSGSSLTIQQFIQGAYVAANDTATAPEIQMWNGNSYDHYFFLSAAYDDDLNEYENVWANGVGDYTTYAIPAGEGFWIKNKVGSSVNLVISK